MITLGQEKKIVGNTTNDFFVQTQRVGNLIQFSLEKILSLNPTHIIYQDFQKNWMAPLEKLSGLKRLEVSFTDIQSIIKSSEMMIEFLNLDRNILESKKQWLKKTLAEKKEFDFFYLAVVDRGPDFKQVFAAGKGSYLDELLALTGGNNVIESDRDYIQISDEYLLASKKIDVIIDFSLGNTDVHEFHKIPVIRVSDLKMTVPDLNFYEKKEYFIRLLNKIFVNYKKSQFLWATLLNFL